MLYEPPRTADAEVDAASILEPFSNSNEPLFQFITPICIHVGRCSYASCNLESKSLAVEALLANTATFTFSLNMI